MVGMESPEYVRTSLAAAIVLGAKAGRFYRDVCLRCINLLLTYPDGCHANCAYCGLARGRPGGYRGKSFIRVDWPTLPTEEVIERMIRYSADVSRVCVSMITHHRAYQDTVDVIRRIRQGVDAPLSALIAPNLFDRDRLLELRRLGVDTVGIGLDAASEVVFERTRGRGVKGPLYWSQYWQMIAEARQAFGPSRVNAHLVVGIGETDRDLVEVILRLKKMEVCAYLFCFYPETDSLMARRRRPSLRRFRRIQLVKYLLEMGRLSAREIGYDEAGRIRRLSTSAPLIEQAIRSGQPFFTNGCPGKEGTLACTRPFGSYRPGEPFRDFPFQPTEDDLTQVCQQLRWWDLVDAPYVHVRRHCPPSPLPELPQSGTSMGAEGNCGAICHRLLVHQHPVDECAR